MSLQFDNKISLGHVLTALAMTVAGVTGYANLRASQAQTAMDITAVRAVDQGHDNRLRALEVAQAGQSSDLRSIQASLARIERLLEAERP